MENPSYNLLLHPCLKIADARNLGGGAFAPCTLPPTPMNTRVEAIWKTVFPSANGLPLATGSWSSKSIMGPKRSHQHLDYRYLFSVM